mmetsp:Transcript_28694/g.49537  ORF Transcript_28694/g.49537 Transcript_28694/m.49537 type:complete len:732 (-) Transcript_28694:110-2305(-)
MSSPTRSMKPSPTKSTLLLALLLLFASSSLAIDLGRFGKKSKDDLEQQPVMTSEEALANAKKLVNDLNDAATGTVTSYQPGREKEPVTCNEIMAKSLVVSNEEKAALTGEKNAVVKAAALLAGQIDDLTEELKTARGDMSELERMLSDAKVDHEAKLKEAAESAELDIREIGIILSDARMEHENKLKDVMEDSERYNQGQEQKFVADMERSKIMMDTFKNATSATVAKAEIDHAEKIAAKDAEVAEQIAAAEQQMEQIKAEAQERIKASQQGADDMVASITAKAATERMNLLEATQKQIDEVTITAKKRVSLMETDKMNEEVDHLDELSELMRAHATKIREMEVLMKKNVQEVHDEMEKAIAKADAKLSAERAKHAGQLKEMEESMVKLTKDMQGENKRVIAKADERVSVEQKKYRELEGKLGEVKDEALKSRRTLTGDIQLLRTNSFKLEKEVSSWKETYESRGYCNATLIKEDSQRILTNAFDSASRGLDSTHKSLMSVLSAQLELVQSKGSHVIDFVEEEVLPNIERIVGEACDKAAALYDAHLAVAVNENLVPLYNEHIYPIYNEHILPMYIEHVSPVIKTIEGEAAAVMDKSSKEAQRARSGAAKLVKQSSSTALGVMKEKEIDSMLPGWLVSQITHSSKDGEWAVDRLCKGLLILIVVLCRSLIKRLVWGVFSLVWFFCPLRLFVGGRRKTVVEKNSNGAKKKSEDNTKGGVTKSKTNGKMAKAH